MPSEKSLPQRSMRFASILIVLAATGFLCVALSSRLLNRVSSSALLASTLAALVMAVALHIRFLLLARREQRETAAALDATEREYKSVFDNTLDGIVVFDDRGVCVQANEAAGALLRDGDHPLQGKPISAFFAQSNASEDGWNAFLEGNNAHGEAQIVRPDGASVCIEYSLRANYLLGRHVAVLRDITERKRAQDALRESEERFQQMANNIQEIFWMFDAGSKKVVYINRAYEIITGRSCELLCEDSRSFREVIHPEDRVRVLSRLSASLEQGRFDEEFRIVTPNGAVRWVWARGFPVRDPAGIVRRLVGSAQDISARKSAEREIARNLDLAEAARAEAEAFRKTSLALTENLSMDYVLDTLLASLLKLVPYESAQVLLIETDTHLFVARELQNCEPGRLPPAQAILDARDSRQLMRILAHRKSLLLSDTDQEREWLNFKGFAHLRSWLCVPLVTSRQILGFLSLGDTRAHAFTREHLRLAESLAIPAAVAIQNARLYEQAEIFRTEIEQRLADLQQADRIQQSTHRADRFT